MIDRMVREERMRKVIAEMITWKRQWLDLIACADEQYKREDTLEELKGDY